MTRKEFIQSGLATAGAILSDPIQGVKFREVVGDIFARIGPNSFEFSLEPRTKFRMLQITDTHFGSNNDEARRNDEKTKALIRELLQTYKPNMILHSGDIINNDQENPDFSSIEFLKSFGSNVLPVFGNHDHPNGLPGQLTLDEYASRLADFTFGRFDPFAGSSEYCYDVDLKIKGQKPFLSIFAFNTGSPFTGMKVSDIQLEWIENKLRDQQNKGFDHPVFILQHVPTIEFKKLFEEGHPIGRQGESVCFEQDQGEVFARYERLKRVKAIFCGHDHINDYLGPYRTIQLVYGRCTGFNGYGDWERGARLIDFNISAGTVTTQVVLGKGAAEKPEWSKTLAPTRII